MRSFSVAASILVLASMGPRVRNYGLCALSVEGEKKREKERKKERKKDSTRMLLPTKLHARTPTVRIFSVARRSLVSRVVFQLAMIVFN